MIPRNNSILLGADAVTRQPTRTYQMDLKKNRIYGHTDETEAMKQAIYKMLSTDRYQYILYSWDYGVELLDLFGMPVSYVCPELERRITEALLWDDRISGVSNFTFDTTKKGAVQASFTVSTIFGNIPVQKEVMI